MTDIVETPPVAVVPIFPPVGSPAFNNDAYTFGTAMPGVAQTLHDTAEAAHTNALAAQEQALAAASQANDARQHASEAIAARDVVWGAPNFRGLWGDLSGGLLKPATVKHGGRFWLLNEDLADVTLHEPGVSAAWISLDAGVRPQQSVASGAVACVAGVTYIITGSDVTLTAPATGLIQGDVFAFRLAASVSGTQCVDFGGIDVRGQVAGLRFIDAPGFALDLQFNSGKGWV